MPHARLRLPSLFALFSLVILPSAAHADPRRYTLFIGDRPAGEATLRVNERVRDVDFSFRDRGLGPTLREHIVLGGDGLPRELTVDGRDHSGAIADKFRGDDKRAMYLSPVGTPEEYAILVRALVANKGTLPLLPSGTATLERVQTLTVSAGGKTQKVTAYALGGIDLQPFIVWLDEQEELFCTGNMIANGWDAAASSLGAVESRYDETRHRRLAQTLTRIPKHAVAFEHARLFDPETRRLLPDTTVLVDGERIRAVGRDGRVTIPADAERIDVRGRVMMPGLWDLHVHAGRSDGILLIAAGVTTVRNMGSPSLSPKQPFSDDGAIGPRELFVGVLDGNGPNASPTQLRVDREPAVREAIDRLAAAGFVQAKVYNSFKASLVPAFVDEAHKRGLRASGHVPDGMKALDLVRAGVDELQHAYMVLLQFVSEKELTPVGRFTAFAKQAGAIDFDSAPVRDFIAELKRRRVDVDITLVSGEQELMARAGEPSPVYAAVAPRLPPQARRQLERGAIVYSPSAFAATLELAHALYAAGVPLAFGTDETLYGFSAERELELWVKAGIPAADTLYAATLGAARIMKQEGESGSVAPGKLADFVIVDGDPLADISAARRPTLVCKNGRLYDPIALWHALGIASY